MTFYQELQLNQAGSKKLICASETKKEKYRHIAVYLFKIILTISFCVVFVTLFSMIFGTENSVAGVVILLALLTFRQADLGIHTAHSAAALTIIFGILAAGPRAACVLPPFAALFVNAGCILLIMVLGCYPVAMSNQSTFVLGYLLLMGYDVSGQTYLLRLAGLGIGGAAVILIFLRSHRNRSYEKKFSDLFREFSLSSDRTRWQICLALGVSTALLIAQLLSVPRGMWIGIAVMSVLQPLRKDLQYRLKVRAPGNILGGALFLLLYHFLPGDICAYIGIIGGIGVGLSASYGWQAVFNSFGGVALAVPLFGVPGAVLLRIFNNAAGSVYAFCFERVFQGGLTGLLRAKKKQTTS